MRGAGILRDVRMGWLGKSESKMVEGFWSGLNKEDAIDMDGDLRFTGAGKMDS